MKRDILYVLTTPEFFTEGPCGRVSHASGFVEGACENGASLTLLSGPGAEEFVDIAPIKKRQVRPGFLWWPALLIKALALVCRHRVVVVRWRPILPFLFLPFLLLNRRIWFEVNALTGLDSSNPLIRALVRVSVWLSTHCFNVLTVSEVSLDRIAGVSTLRRLSHVMPNGFRPDQLEEFQVNRVPNAPVSLVYFGIRQPYYEWDLLYQACENLSDDGVISAFHGFGYDETGVPGCVRPRGVFNRASLVRDLTEIVNPVLVVHSAGSDVARATSPVKLFEYAALALPVVCSASMRRQAAALPAFRFYEPGDRAGFEAAVRDVAINYDDELSRAGTSRKVAKERYTWPAVVGQWMRRVL